MSEANFWDEIRIGMGNSWQATRIESHESAPGFPDVDYCMSNGEQGHLELKFGYWNDMPKIEDNQLRWHTKRYKMGGVSFFFSRIKYHSMWYYMLHKGRQARYLSENKAAQDWIETSFWYCTALLDFKQLTAILKSELDYDQ